LITQILEKITEIREFRYFYGPFYLK